MAYIGWCYTLLTVLLCLSSLHIFIDGTGDEEAVYIGCFQDSSKRALDDYHLNDPHDMTHALCFQECRSSSSPYAGLQHYKHCFCGSNYDRYGPLHESLCYAPCSGNPDEVCGGAWANSVYLIVYRKAVCENKLLDIDCQNHYISIRSANYGALPGDSNNLYCNDWSVSEVCQSAISLSLLEDYCQGKHTCNVSATNSVFGDPCSGVRKYLTVSYTCVKNETDSVMDTIITDVVSTQKSVPMQDFTPTVTSITTDDIIHTQMSLTTQVQMFVSLDITPDLIDSVNEPVFTNLQWQFPEPVESIDIHISWGDGRSTEEEVAAGVSGDHAFSHTYPICGCFKVKGEVTGDDHQLCFEEQEVCSMDKITSLDISIQDKSGTVIESGSAISLNASLTASVSVLPRGRTCHATSWELSTPSDVQWSKNEGFFHYRLTEYGLHNLSVSAENKISVMSKDVLIYAMPDVTVACDSQSTVGVPVMCTLEVENDCECDLQIEVNFGDRSSGFMVSIQKGYSKEKLQHIYQNTGNYNITVSVEDIVQNKHLVTVTDGTCKLTVASIRGISRDVSLPTVFTRNSRVHIGSIIEVSCSTEVVSLVIKWTLYSVSSGAVDSAYILPSSVATNKTDLVIPPRILDVGSYRVLLLVTLEDEDGDVTGRDAAEGWMVIMRSSIIALIDGGSKRTVGQSSSVLLDGSSSYDPDFGDSPHQFDPGLVFSWSCLPVPIPSFMTLMDITCDGSTLSNSSDFVVAQDSITSPQTLEFQLKVEKGDRFAVASQQLVFVSGDVPQISVRCIQNCGSYLMSSNNLVLKASCTNCLKSGISYSWKIFVLEENEVRNKLRHFQLKKTSLTGQNKDHLVMKMEAFMELSPGLYSLEASGVHNGEVGRSEYRFSISSPPVNGTCSVTPQNGTVLETKFNVICEGYIDADQPLRYSLYRTEPSGIATLVSTYTDVISPSIFLPVGNDSDTFLVSLVVKVSDVYGFSAYAYLSVKVFPISELSGGSLGEHLMNLTSGPSSMLGNLLTSGNREAVNQVMVSMATILNDPSQRGDGDIIDLQTRSQIRETLMNSLSDVTVQTTQDVLQASSSLSLITTSSQELSPETQITAVSIISSLTSFMKAEESPNETGPVTRMLATGLSNVLEGALLDTKKNDSLPDNATRNHQRDIVLSGIDAIDALQDILVANMVPGESPSSITTPLFALSVSRQSTSVMADTQTIKSTLGVGHFQLPGEGNLYSNVTNKDNQTESSVAIQLIAMPTNPFDWSSVDNLRPVTSGLLGLKLKTDKKELRVSGLDENPVSIILRQSADQVSSEEFQVMSGSVVGLNVSIDRRGPSELVQISLVPSTPGIPVIGCIHGNISSDDDMGFGDSCLETFSLPHQIKAETSTTESLYTWIGEVPLSHDDDHMLQLQVRVGEISKPEDWNDSYVNLSIYSSSTGCVFWDEDKETWSERGCQPGPLSDPWNTQCLCSHLSFFGSTVLVRPNKIDLIADARLFLTFVENPLVVSTVVVVFVGYLLVVIWAYRRDKVDLLKAQVTVLEDNDPFDQYRYLVTVVTGWRCGASTTANVTLTLYGRNEQSEPHILKSISHRILEAGGHDTFLLTTCGTLGEVTAIRLWHDSAGTHPEWYVSRVNVHDLETDSNFLFICNCWLASTIDDGKVDRTFTLATPEKLSQFGNNFTAKTTTDFQDEHLWFSVLTRPPRSPFSRVQRVSCCFSLMMTAMMTNIMFYGIPSSPGEQVLDFGAVRVTIQEIIIGVEAALIAFPVNFVIVSLFRNARPAGHGSMDEEDHLSVPAKSSRVPEMNKDEKSKQIASNSDIYISMENETESVCLGSCSGMALIPGESGYLSSHTEFCSSTTTDINRNCRDADYSHMLSCAENLENSHQVPQGKAVYAMGHTRKHFNKTAAYENGKSLAETEEMDHDENHHNRLLYSKLMGLVTELEMIGPGCFSSEVEYEKALAEARALVLTAVSVVTPCSSSFDTSISTDEESKGKPGKDDRWYSWLRRQPQRVNVKDSRRGIPHMFVYLAWFLLVATCLTSGYVTMLYGLKYGKQRSLDWLVSLFVSTLQSIFITQPLKIVLLAMFLSLIFRQWDDEDDGAVNLEVDEKELDNAQEIHQRLAQVKREDVRYQPPAKEEVDTHRKLKEHEKNMYALLMEIVGYLMFIWLLLVITYSRRDRYGYYMTKNIRNRYFDGNKLYRVNLTHYEGFFEWTENAVIPNLYSLSDYEGDTQSVLLGGVRIRQMRVKPGSCDVLPLVEDTISDCWSPYNRKSKDTTGYNSSWQSQQPNQAQDALNPWSYQEDISFPFGGKVTFYDNGGYVWYLGNNREEAEEQIREMKCSRWLDANTRAIFVDWTVFNANINMFAVVTCLLETPAGGGMLKTFTIHSVRLYRSTSNTTFFVTLCEAAFTFSLFYYMYRDYKLWREQRASYWHDCWNWLEVAIILNALAMIVLYVMQLVFIKHLFQEFRRQPNQFHDFRRGAMMENNLTYSSAFLVILSTIKFLHLLRLNPRMYLLTSVVFRSASEVLGFMFMILLLICTFSLFFTLYIGSQVMDYRSFVASFITLYNAIPGNFSVDEIRRVARVFGPWATFLFQFLSYFLFLDLLISALNENMTHIRQNPKMSEDGIMGLLLISKILSFFGIKKKVKYKENC